MAEREQHTVTEQAQTPKSTLSMHEGVEVWDDCCVCEAEPYWIEAMEEDEAEEK